MKIKRHNFVERDLVQCTPDLLIKAGIGMGGMGTLGKILLRGELSSENLLGTLRFQ